MTKPSAPPLDLAPEDLHVIMEHRPRPGPPPVLAGQVHHRYPGTWTLVKVVVVVPVLWLLLQGYGTSTTSPCTVKRSLEPLRPLPDAPLSPLSDTPLENSWILALHTQARTMTNKSCYVCGRIPHSRAETVPVQPIPANVTELVSLLAAFTLHDGYVSKGFFRVFGSTNQLDTFDFIAIDFNNSRLRFNFDPDEDEDNLPDKVLYQPVLRDLAHTQYSPPVCFTLTCNARRRFLGTSRHCKDYLAPSCGRTATIPCCKQTNKPFYSVLNISSTPCKPGRSPCNPNHFYSPSEDGYWGLERYVWQCGPNVYQILPRGWCGTCHLAKLVPDIFLTTSLAHSQLHYPHYFVPGSQTVPHRLRRDTRISPGRKFGSGILPWYGVVANAHDIDRIARDLENLTAMTLDSFRDLSHNLQLVGNAEVQNRMGLDMLMASTGGLCHTIGQSCCTWSPADMKNLSEIVTHLNDLLHDEKAQDSPASSGWDVWGWLNLSAWKTWLIKGAVFIGIFLITLLVLTCCVVPYIKSMVSRLVTTTFVHLNNPDTAKTDDCSDTDSVFEFLCSAQTHCDDKVL